MEDHIMKKAKFNKQLTIALPPDHFEKIKQITDQEETSIAEWCRKALAEALKSISDDRQNL